MMISKADFYLLFLLLILIIQLSVVLSCDCGLQRVRIALEMPGTEKCADNTNRTLTYNVEIKQCFGVCLGESLACLPLSTRLRKVLVKDKSSTSSPRKRRMGKKQKER